MIQHPHPVMSCWEFHHVPLLLFLIYIDGVCEVEFSSNSCLVLYAGDILMYSPVSCQADYQLLQRDVDTIWEWSTWQHLTLNPDKCKFMVVSRRMEPITQCVTLMLNNTPMEKPFIKQSVKQLCLPLANLDHTSIMQHRYGILIYRRTFKLWRTLRSLL